MLMAERFVNILLRARNANLVGIYQHDVVKEKSEKLVKLNSKLIKVFLSHSLAQLLDAKKCI